MRNAIEWNHLNNLSKVEFCICNRMRPGRIKDKFSLVFSKFSQIALVATRLGKTLKIQVKIYP